MRRTPALVVALGPGPRRDTLVAHLADRDPKVVDDPSEIALGPAALLLLADPLWLSALRSALGPGPAIVAVLDVGDDESVALAAGADEVARWPGSVAVLTRRVALFLDGRVGPGRVVLDPLRTTSLAHAIRNPLNVITLYAELLKMEGLGPEGLGSVGRIVRAAQRVDALVGEFESILYLEAGLAPIRLQPVVLEELVEAVLGELAYDIEDKPLDVTTELGPALAAADLDLARRAVHAVFARVAKLCLGRAKVTIRTADHPPRIEILAPIAPIPPSEIGRLCAPATELDAREALGGVGVGLSYAHRALSAMGGALEFAVAPDGRAETRLRFVPPSDPPSFG